MNIHLPSLTLTAILLAATLSCNKETMMTLAPDDIITAYVSDFATRTDLSDRATYWCVGDSIKLFDSDGHYATYECISRDDTEYGKATFVRKPGGTGFVMSKFQTAFYPAEYVTSYSSGTVTASIPSTLSYAADTLRAPMASNQYASNTKTLTFANAFAVIDVSVFGTGTVSSIDLTSSTSILNGSFKFNVSGTNQITVTPPTIGTGTSNCISLNCGTSGITLGPDFSTATSFLIPIPATITDRSKLTAKLNFIGGTTPVTPESMTVTANTSLQSSPNYIAQNYILRMSPDTFILPHYIDEYGEDRGVGILIGNVIWAPVNCGYTPTDYPYGKLYQWGRKVGGGYNDGSTYNEQEQTATPATWTDNYNKSPEDTKFYYNDVGPFDWYTNSSGTQLSEWPMTAPASTSGIGNPCPSGWRVPTLDELGSLFYKDWNPSSHSGSEDRGSWDGDNKVWRFSDSFSLPSTGFRRCYDGNPQGRGSSGIYWSSCGSVTFPQAGAFLHFEESSVVVYCDGRAMGNSVRCVRE